jgi:ribosomal protein S18 acetylase RimI-like enzyme
VKHSSEELSSAIDESFVDAFATLCTASPKAILRNEGDVILYSSGAPSALLNGVLAARFSPENMSKRTDEALSFFKGRGLPMTFFVGPCCTPPELDKHLLREGLVAGWTRPGMARNLTDFEPGKLPAGLEIRPVENMASLGVCAETFARGFGTDNESVGWLRTLVMGYGISNTRRWFLGYFDGKPAATSLLVLHKGLAGIYCVATLPKARGRGIGNALTAEPMLIAKDLGYDFAVLQSSKMGLPVYERLGFREYCKIRAYCWSPK